MTKFLWQLGTTTSSVAIHEAPASAGAFYFLQVAAMVGKKIN